MGRGAFPPFGLGLAVLAVWLQCHAGVAAQAVTVATDGPGNFQGYFVNSVGTTRTVTCSTNSFWAQSSTFGGCCSIGGNCNFPTACNDGMMTNRFGGTATCSDRKCYTMTIYGDFPSATDSWLVHNCAYTWTASTLWRAMPTPTTTTMSSSSSSMTMTTTTATATMTSSSTATSSGTAEADAVATGASATAAADAANEDTVEQIESSSSSSKAWIAGVVLGCLAVAGALGALGFWMGRRQRRGGSTEDGGGGTKGFNLITSAHVRSGGSPNPGSAGGGPNPGSVGTRDADGRVQYYAEYPPPSYGAEYMTKQRANAFVVADGVEMEATARSHVELEAGPIPGTPALRQDPF